MSPKPTALTAPRKIGCVLVSVHDTEPVTAPEPGAPDNGPAVAPIEGPTSTPSYTPMVAGNLGDVYLRATQATTQAGTDELAGLRPDESSTAPNEPSLASHVGGVLTEAAQKVPERFFAGTKQAADAILPTDPNDPRSGLRRTWDAVTGVLEASFPFSAAAGHISGAVAEAVVRKNGSMTDEALKARRAEYVAAQQAGGTGVDGVDYSEFIASVDNQLKMPNDARTSQARQTAEVAGELV